MTVFLTLSDKSPSIDKPQCSSNVKMVKIWKKATVTLVTEFCRKQSGTDLQS